MMRKQFSRLALSALMVLGVISAPALAETQPQQPAAVPANGPINFSKLLLTSDQVKKLNILRFDYNKQAIQLKADIKLKELEIQHQLSMPAMNLIVVRQLMSDKLAIDSRLQKLALEQFLAFKKMLTAEQLARLPGAMNIR